MACTCWQARASSADGHPPKPPGTQELIAEGAAASGSADKFVEGDHGGRVEAEGLAPGGLAGGGAGAPFAEGGGDVVGLDLVDRQVRGGCAGSAAVHLVAAGAGESRHGADLRQVPV